MNAGRAPTQRIVDQAGNRGAVTRAGEAVREPPVLERIGRRPVPRFDVGNDLDGSGEPGGGCHQMPSEDAHDEDRPHQHEHDCAHDERAAALTHIVVRHVDVGLDEPHGDEDPCQDDEEKVRVAGDPGEDRQHVEKNGQLELIEKGVAELGRALRPVRLAQGDIGRSDRARLESLGALIGHPAEQREGQHHLDEQRKQHGLYGHDMVPRPDAAANLAAGGTERNTVVAAA